MLAFHAERHPGRVRLRANPVKECADDTSLEL
jgi:hypothetical protein